LNPNEQGRPQQAHLNQVSFLHNYSFQVFNCEFVAAFFISFAAIRFMVFLSRIQRTIRGQIEFASHARVDRVGEGEFTGLPRMATPMRRKENF